jgi:hypothetical protein
MTLFYVTKEYVTEVSVSFQAQAISSGAGLEQNKPSQTCFAGWETNTPVVPYITRRVA